MGDSSTCDHTDHKHRRVSVTLSGHNKLTTGAAAGKREAETGKQHAEEIPQRIRMCDRLIGETRVELAKVHVYSGCCNKESYDSPEEIAVTGQNQIAQSADRAEAAALSKPADDEHHAEPNCPRRMHRTRPLF